MILDSSQVPGTNSTTPFSPDELCASDWLMARTAAAGAVAKSVAQCVPSPASMPSAGVAIEAQQAQQSQIQGLTRNTEALNPIVNAASGDGALISASDISGAPVVIPWINLPSAQPASAQPTPFPKRRRRVVQPGTPWGVPPAADTTGPCAVAPTLIQRLRDRPWGAVVLIGGLGLIAYGATEGQRR